jgi:hypothetical protein
MFIKKIDLMLFNSHIANINTCFSLITLMPDKHDEIYQIYENILGGTFLQTLELSLTMSVSSNLLIEMLKSLSYLYQALKYDRLRTVLETSFLVHPATLKALMQNINDKRPEIRYYTCAMMGAMANNVKNLGTLILDDKNHLYAISNCISQIR